MCVCVGWGGGIGREGGRGLLLVRKRRRSLFCSVCVDDSSGAEEQRWELAEGN